MLKDKPYFTLAFDVSGASYAITVNGMEAFTVYDGSPLVAEVPVNHLMKSGENSIGIHVIHFKDDSAGERPKASVKLRVRQSGQSSSDAIVLSELIYGKGGTLLEPRLSQRYDSSENLALDDQGDVKVSEAVAVDREGGRGKYISQTIYVENSLPLWAMFGSDRFFDKIPETVPDDDYFPVADVAEKELFAIYQDINSQLKAGNVNAVMPYFEERNRELDAAFYRDQGETANHLYESLMETVNDDDYKIDDLDIEVIGVGFSDNAVLVKMERGDGSAAIAFDLKGGGHRSYDMIFRRQNGKYILTR